MPKQNPCMYLGWSLWILTWSLFVLFYQELIVVLQTSMSSDTGMGMKFAPAASHIHWLNTGIGIAIIMSCLLTMFFFYRNRLSITGPALIIWGGILYVINPLVSFLTSLFWIPLAIVGLSILTVSCIHASRHRDNLDFN